MSVRWWCMECVSIDWEGKDTFWGASVLLALAADPTMEWTRRWNPVRSFLSLPGQGDGWVLWLLIPFLSVGGLSAVAAGGLRLSSSIAVDSAVTQDFVDYLSRRFYSWGVRSSDSPSFNSSSLSPSSDPISWLVWSFHEEKARNGLIILVKTWAEALLSSGSRLCDKGAQKGILFSIVTSAPPLMRVFLSFLASLLKASFWLGGRSAVLVNRDARC